MTSADPAWQQQVLMLLAVELDIDAENSLRLVEHFRAEWPEPSGTQLARLLAVAGWVFGQVAEGRRCQDPAGAVIEATQKTEIPVPAVHEAAARRILGDLALLPGRPAQPATPAAALTNANAAALAKRNEPDRQAADVKPADALPVERAARPEPALNQPPAPAVAPETGIAREPESGEQDLREQPAERAGIFDGLARLAPKAMVDAKALAQLLGVRTTKTITRMVQRGELPPPLPFGGRSRWVVEAIFKHVEECAAARATEVAAWRAAKTAPRPTRRVNPRTVSAG